MSAPAQRGGSSFPRFEYCQVSTNRTAFVDILFYEQERGVAIRKDVSWPAVMAALGLAGWRLVGFDPSGDLWFLRPWIPGRRIDDVHIVAPKSVYRHSDETPDQMPNLLSAAESVWFSPERLHVRLVDGRELSLPLAWFPRLEQATPEQRMAYEIWNNGRDIRWAEVNEDISVPILLGLLNEDE